MRIGRREFHFSSKRLFTWLMVISVGMLFLPRGLTDRLDHLFSMVSSPFNRCGRVVSLAAMGKLRSVGGGKVSSEDYERLLDSYRRDRAKLVNLSQQLEEQSVLLGRIQGLRQQFGMARARLIDAQIVGTGTISWRRMNKAVVRKLDQGSVQRLEAGQIALGYVGGDNGVVGARYDWCVVGKVLSSGVGTANVQLACDVDFNLGIFVAPGPQRDGNWRAEGVLHGDGTDGMVCVVSRPDHPVQVGDVVVACSDPATLPIATLVGYVRQCEADEQTPLLWRIAVAPAADLNGLDRVVVIDTH